LVHNAGMTVASKSAAKGRPHRLGSAELDVIRQLALANPAAPIVELTRMLSEQLGARIDRFMMARALKRAGVQRVRRAKRATPRLVPTPHRFTDEHRAEGPPRGYPSSLTDHEWALVRDLFENTGPGRPPKHSRRTMFDAIAYVVRSGCAWRMLPRHFPKWQTVYAAFREWSTKERFVMMHARLAAIWREREERDANPTATVIDSQSVRTSAQGGPRGFDANKKIKGRKRHIATDTLGLLLAVVVTAASVQDRDVGPAVLDAALARYPTLAMVYVDQGYAGRCADEMRTRDVRVDVVRRRDKVWATAQLSLLPTPARGFEILPKRWVVERTNAWNDSPRRMAKDYDRRLDVSETWIWITEGRLLLRRVARAQAA
jgi:transposase